MKKESIWEKKDEREEIYRFAEKYIDFLNSGKTEREVVNHGVRMAEELDDVIMRKVKNKALCVSRKSDDILNKGIRFVVAHIDSPRIDLKPTPLYQEQEMALLKTHYYGGIRKYQWLSIPLAIHGVVVKENGELMNVVIGEKEEEPVFTIPDLLPHLSKKQQEKKIKEFAKGEELNVLIGSIPGKEKDEDKNEKVLNNIKEILEDKYNIEEQDFISSELELVPAWKARSVGLDESFVGGYGQDDRICGFAALMALLSLEEWEKVPAVILFDKEEIGSVGNSGAASDLVENFIIDILESSDIEPTFNNVKKIMDKSSVLSGDVNPGIHPTYSDVHDKYNASKVGYGVVLTKYTGVWGKAGSNDAHAEFVAEVRKIFNENDIVWQIGEIGKVDLGGGGTVAKFLAKYGMDVIDSGPPLLAMHSPFEIVSKADLYETFRAYRSFLKS